MVFNKVSRKRQIKHYGEWFAGGDLDYFGQSSYPIACNIIFSDLSAWEFIMPSIHWATSASEALGLFCIGYIYTDFKIDPVVGHLWISGLRML